MLSILPWLMSRPEGASIDEVCHRFDITREQLLADLDVVWMVGVYPYSPDCLVDVVVDHDRVSVQFADAFRHPLRMTPDQGLAVVATARSLATAPGADPDGPLARATAKVAAVLGVDPATVEVDLGEATSATLDVLRRAVEADRQVELDYYTYGRDEHTHRIVDPYRVYADQGQWYLEAHCHQSDGERIFRVDRVRAATLLDTTFDRPAADPELGLFRPTDATPRVTLELTREARWVPEQYPVEAVEELDDGGLRVTLAIAARPWFERLLLRLGPSARVVQAPAELADAGPRVATRILARYHRDR
jgi:proteasome accessory factor C